MGFLAGFLVKSLAMVKTGLMNLLADGASQLAGKRIGILTNPTGVDEQLTSTIDRLWQLPNLKIVALFGPEHGLRGDAQDMAGVGNELDPKTKLPVYSLYGHGEETLKPTAEMLQKLDAIVFDIQ